MLLSEESSAAGERSEGESSEGFEAPEVVVDDLEEGEEHAVVEGEDDREAGCWERGTVVKKRARREERDQLLE